jgi:hypothetical protein
VLGRHRASEDAEETRLRLGGSTQERGPGAVDPRRVERDRREGASRDVGDPSHVREGRLAGRGVTMDHDADALAVDERFDARVSGLGTCLRGGGQGHRRTEPGVAERFGRGAAR